MYPREWPVDTIASACGFGSAVTFRQNFAAVYGTTPTAYRRRFATAPAPRASGSGT
ncbi:helix-turn-helix domain-containing protein [Nocardia farcinica]|uniref:helix-turn-helix domain-containing protein n=1 Tax=Nocardia farcinica TaxID=37329 RepID=UPI0024558B04|nr:helix-turn-helix domain-containing protein [Nocardia farcinica]